MPGVRGVSYETRPGANRPAGRHIGLLAQEVEKAYPELVTKDESGTLSVAYGNFTAVCTWQGRYAEALGYGEESLRHYRCVETVTRHCVGCPFWGPFKRPRWSAFRSAS